MPYNEVSKRISETIECSAILRVVIGQTNTKVNNAHFGPKNLSIGDNVR